MERNFFLCLPAVFWTALRAFASNAVLRPISGDPQKQHQEQRDEHGIMFKFEIAPSRKEVLLKGLDDIGTTL